MRFDNHMGPICLVRSDVFLYICFVWPGYIMAINCFLHNYHGSITSLRFVVCIVPLFLASELVRYAISDYKAVVAVVSVDVRAAVAVGVAWICLLYTSPSPRDNKASRMPSSA